MAVCQLIKMWHSEILIFFGGLRSSSISCKTRTKKKVKKKTNKLCIAIRIVS